MERKLRISTRARICFHLVSMPIKKLATRRRFYMEGILMISICTTLVWIVCGMYLGVKAIISYEKAF